MGGLSVFVVNFSIGRVNENPQLLEPLASTACQSFPPLSFILPSEFYGKHRKF